MTDYAAVLSSVYPDASWSLVGNDFTTLEWFDEGDAPTQDVLDPAWPHDLMPLCAEYRMPTSLLI